MTKTKFAPCKKCDRKIRWGGMRKHQKSETCRRGHRVKQLKKLGYIHTDYIRLVQGVQDGIIPGVAVPHKYKIYVPWWVHQAAYQYEHNKGYAGMNFIEFVNRMRPEDK